ncbi:class I SAM-dependent methyltransferase [Heyndrickxia acidicola]|uniref:Class I SAM-dependent methyltransferase n=1 Tax=Heyndrickxia acidicola TaxID=209389 RepID=A0ABU6MMC5_9BACI|nr:class I SAM-dependent methyltransferase [Heyndrickxia acidicola]MED1205670.1 class I SAM-dependent methyltransferase [Heyndrickxia acidicola]
MPDHYYSRNPGVESKPIFWDFTLRDNTFHFKTDQGVFSKNEVDYGSRLLVESVELPNVAGPLLDVGCGYGPVGLSLAKSFSKRLVHMVDVNLRALELASENAKHNGIENVNIYESDRLHSVAEENFALIVTNPPIRAGKQIVHDILTQSFQHLAPSGELWVVIQKKQGAPSAKAKLEELFEDVDIVKKDKGYFIIRAKKH